MAVEVPNNISDLDIALVALCYFTQKRSGETGVHNCASKNRCISHIGWKVICTSVASFDYVFFVFEVFDIERKIGEYMYNHSRTIELVCFANTTY